MAAPKGPQAKEATMFVRRTFPNGSEKEDRGPIEVSTFLSEPAYVTAKAKRTVNLGDYESMSIEVGVTYPCYPEEVDEGMEWVSAKIGSFLMNEVDEVKQAKAAGVL